MSLFILPLLLNLFLLPFYVTKFPRRFLVTWHLIPLLGAQWGFWGVLSATNHFLSPLDYYSLYPGLGPVGLFIRETSVIMIGCCLASIFGFFYSWLASRDEDVLKGQRLQDLFPKKKFLAILLIRYYSLPMFFYSIFLYLSEALCPARTIPVAAVLFLSSLLFYRLSNSQIMALSKSVEVEMIAERRFPFNNTDYKYLFIPLGISAVAAGLLFLQ